LHFQSRHYWQGVCYVQSTYELRMFLPRKSGCDLLVTWSMEAFRVVLEKIYRRAHFLLDVPYQCHISACIRPNDCWLLGFQLVRGWYSEVDSMVTFGPSYVQCVRPSHFEMMGPKWNYRRTYWDRTYTIDNYVSLARRPKWWLFDSSKRDEWRNGWFTFRRLMVWGAEEDESVFAISGRVRLRISWHIYFAGWRFHTGLGEFWRDKIG
jgi:hypothetical protein